ncbi:MAG: 3-dehydroquinate synthase [Luteitalea sp.]|nr:3-dehydroquinate synthase [Luteitalea sp.]
MRIPVHAGPREGYAVEIENGLLGGLAEIMRSVSPEGTRRVVLSSPRIWRLHGATVAAGLPSPDPILVPDGERAKQLTTVQRVYEALIRANADRTAQLVVVGGGVLGDLGGFAAATYLRGIAYVQVPTTLLAQVDSAIGGKVGVNHALGKNLIGAFHHPRLVVSDPLVLRTLSRREFRAGLYEVVKYAVIASRPLFDRLVEDLPQIVARQAAALLPVISECCRIKAEVVGADEREHGLRRILNFGHTAGHALEAVTKYRRFRHGEAVAYGMRVAAWLARARGALAPDAYDGLDELLTRLGPLPAVGDVSAAACLEAMRHDKKVLRGTLHFVLPVGIGRTAIVTDVTEPELATALRAIGLRL